MRCQLSPSCLRASHPSYTPSGMERAGRPYDLSPRLVLRLADHETRQQVPADLGRSGRASSCFSGHSTEHPRQSHTDQSAAKLPTATTSAATEPDSASSASSEPGAASATYHPDPSGDPGLLLHSFSSEATSGSSSDPVLPRTISRATDCPPATQGPGSVAQVTSVTSTSSVSVHFFSRFLTLRILIKLG